MSITNQISGEIAAKISVERTKNPKPKPSIKDLGFGKYFTDHMFVARYTTKGGWEKGAVVPYAPFPMDPAAAVFHYAQELFEGMKAFRTDAGKVQLFRPRFNSARLNEGAKRLCMPEVPESLMIEGIKALVRTDIEWLPSETGTSLYIRPTMIATEPFLGVRPADEYLFYIILSPVGSYYGEGSQGVRIWVEQTQVRASLGGLGNVKAGANYVASLQAAWRAKKDGFAQVLWLDAKEHQWIEEVGTMNVFFAYGNRVVTPKLDGTILPGNTRDSVIHLLKHWGVDLQETRVSIKDVLKDMKSGALTEMWGTGTAAVISPIQELNFDGTAHVLQNPWGPLSKRLHQHMTDLQYGRTADTFKWMEPIEGA